MLLPPTTGRLKVGWVHEHRAQATPRREGGWAAARQERPWGRGLGVCVGVLAPNKGSGRRPQHNAPGTRTGQESGRGRQDLCDDSSTSRGGIRTQRPQIPGTGQEQLVVARGQGTVARTGGGAWATSGWMGRGAGPGLGICYSSAQTHPQLLGLRHAQCVSRGSSFQCWPGRSGTNTNPGEVGSQAGVPPVCQACKHVRGIPLGEGGSWPTRIPGEGPPAVCPSVPWCAVLS